jgi:adenylate kinase
MVRVRKPTSSKAKAKKDTSTEAAKGVRPAYPVIIVTGTPGTGKSLLIAAIEKQIPGVKSLNVSDLVKSDEELNDGYDSELDTYIINDRKTRRKLYELITEEKKGTTGLVIECHSCGLFDHSRLRGLISAVLVLSTSTECLFDRLTARGYSEKKRAENLECEIIGICGEDAEAAFPELVDTDSVRRFTSSTEADLEEAIAYVKSLIE